ncbi:MAG: acyl-CoA carboxylase subunit beta [Anaerolineae bacterium]|nr:acyl-CoA carboxylase subunit beta [Anaerolineae bacterium]
MEDAGNDPRIQQLRALRARVRQGGGAQRIARQHAKGKLTARERLDLLLDAGTFNELEPFTIGHDDPLPPEGLSQAQPSPDPDAASLDLVTEKYLGDGVITGYGQIDGRTVYFYAQDFTILGGTLSEMQSRKICRVMDLAVHNGAPIVGLIDSGGARIQEGVRSLGGYAEIFKRNSQYSGVVPQISIMLGPCAGGASYCPALTDLIIMVEKQSFMFITGPEVIKSVTGEVIDQESLGGAAVHMAISGTAHLACRTEPEALALCRRLLGYLPSNNVDNPSYVPCGDDPSCVPSGDELNAIVPIDPSVAYDMHEVLAHIVDRGEFLELQSAWARNAIVALARIGGHTVGLVAQEPSVMAGVIDIDASDKIARFVRMCDCFNIPLVTFIDSPGFLPGIDQEHRGIIRHGAKIVYAYSEATVPKIGITTRKSYGGAYIVMSSKYLGTDVSYAWPSAEIAVMGAEGAVDILFRKEIEAVPDAERAAERQRLVEGYRQRFNNPYQAAYAGYIDDIIEPRETRDKVIAALAALRNKYSTAPARKHGNVPL